MMNYLIPQTLKLLNLPTAERRQAVLVNKWIAYPTAQRIAQQLNNLLNQPAVHQMPALLIAGDTNNGKTALLRRFTAAHGPRIQEHDRQLNCPVLYSQTPAEPAERRFYHAILSEIGTPYQLNDQTSRLQQLVLQALRRTETKMLVIDEIHHLSAGSERSQQHCLNVLKYLSHELKLSLVGAGMNQSISIIKRDEQLAGRFELAELPRWTMSNEFLRLLLSFEQLLPLHKKSNLITDALAHRLLTMSEGLLGELASILKRAAVAAIDNEVECITAVGLDSLDYLPPSRRGEYSKYV